MNYKGSDAFRTKLGAAVSVAMKALVLAYTCLLALKWGDHLDSQSETIRNTKVDLEQDTPHKVVDEGFTFTIVPAIKPLKPEIGRFVLERRDFSKTFV